MSFCICVCYAIGAAQVIDPGLRFNRRPTDPHPIQSHPSTHHHIRQLHLLCTSLRFTLIQYVHPLNALPALTCHQHCSLHQLNCHFVQYDLNLVDVAIYVSKNLMCKISDDFAHIVLCPLKDFLPANAFRIPLQEQTCPRVQKNTQN